MREDWNLSPYAWLLSSGSCFPTTTHSSILRNGRRFCFSAVFSNVYKKNLLITKESLYCDRGSFFFSEMQNHLNSSVMVGKKNWHMSALMPWNYICEFEINGDYRKICKNYRIAEKKDRKEMMNRRNCFVSFQQRRSR